MPVPPPPHPKKNKNNNNKIKGKVSLLDRSKVVYIWAKVLKI